AELDRVQQLAPERADLDPALAGVAVGDLAATGLRPVELVHPADDHVVAHAVAVVDARLLGGELRDVGRRPAALTADHLRPALLLGRAEETGDEVRLAVTDDLARRGAHQPESVAVVAVAVLPLLLLLGEVGVRDLPGPDHVVHRVTGAGFVPDHVQLLTEAVEAAYLLELG